MSKATANPNERQTKLLLRGVRSIIFNKKIVHAIKSKLLPPGVPICSLHPVLEAAIKHDSKILASYLLRTCRGCEFRCLLDLESVLELAFSAIAKLPPSKAYEQVLKDRGCDAVLARGLAVLVARIGRQTAEVAKCRRDIIAAIRVFSVPTSRDTTILKTAKYLLEKSRDCAAVETVFYESDTSPDEFLSLLRSIIGGSTADRQRLAEIVEALAPILKTPSGRKPSPRLSSSRIPARTYAVRLQWDVEKEDFSDTFTKGTRIEFDDSKFSPRAARRRVIGRQNRTA
jgi:hypothetical protein